MAWHRPTPGALCVQPPGVRIWWLEQTPLSVHYRYAFNTRHTRLPTCEVVDEFAEQLAPGALHAVPPAVAQPHDGAGNTNLAERLWGGTEHEKPFNSGF